MPFIRAWITLHSCTLDLMYASVHHFLYKKRNLLFIANTFPSLIFQESIYAKLGGTMKFCLEIHLNSHFHKIYQSINDINIFKFIMGHWLRGRVISKFYVSSKLATLYTSSSFQICDGYVSTHEFFMSFSLNSKSFINSSVLTHNCPPHRLRGSSKMFL